MSIMEAISFGVPVLATGVNGVPEIVGPSTGKLVGLDDQVDSIARAALELLEGDRPTSEEIVAFSRVNFDADTNFGKFAEMLRAM